MDRRQFIKTSVIGGSALALFNLWECEKTGYTFPRRRLGQTGEMLSIIGFGGILVKDEEQANANDLVAEAVAQGINYFDVAPTYGDAEDRLGPALKPYRKNCFLACKTTERSKEGAEKELHESLKKLQTDYFDLYQLHALTKTEDVETAFGVGGAMEVFLKARQEGKVRFIGFSAHSEQAALLAMDNFDFDSLLFPINFVCWFQGNFGPQVVAKAQEKQMGILALKSMAFSLLPQGEKRHYEKCWYLPIDDDETANLTIRFTLSQGTTAAIPPGEAKLFWKAVDIARNFTPITAEEIEKLKEISQGVEPLFKTT